MATVTFFKRIIVEDYDAKDQGLVSKLAFSLNPVLQQVANILQNGLSLSSLNVQIKQVTVAVDANGTPTTPLSFQNTLSDNAQFIQVGRAQNQTKSTVYPTSGPFVSFTQTGTTIEINNITGLTSGDTWLLTLVSYG